ncbi:MAG: mechanosensitive ion channel protein [Deltaproteobacteria bacterium]|nr:MAG: mechanosensitive ion channel protein [Deltaproteobacteria bacterium]
MNFNTQELGDKIIEFLTTYGMNALGAIIILILGIFFSRLAKKMTKRVMDKAKMDPALTGFVSNLIKYAILAFAVVASLAKFGIQTTSFVAILGAAGLAVGLALQGSLSNFAAGVLILIFRPFTLGDFVTAGGNSGTVEEIGIFSTKIVTPDNKLIIIPNSQVTDNPIVNVTAKPKRRVDLIASISYGDDMGKATEVLEAMLAKNSYVLDDPAPVVRVVELADSSVNLVVRPWVNTDDYWEAYFSLTRAIKEELEGAGLSIPFPQRDVHLFNEKE